jgi:hypothetical protein
MARDEVERTSTSATSPHLGPSGRRHAFLLVLAGPQLGDVYALEPGRPLLVGRRADADVAILDDGVSRRHATIGFNPVARLQPTPTACAG